MQSYLKLASRVLLVLLAMEFLTTMGWVGCVLTAPVVVAVAVGWYMTLSGTVLLVLYLVHNVLNSAFLVAGRLVHEGRVEVRVGADHLHYGRPADAGRQWARGAVCGRADAQETVLGARGGWSWPPVRGFGAGVGRACQRGSGTIAVVMRRVSGGLFWFRLVRSEAVACVEAGGIECGLVSVQGGGVRVGLFL
eukprot:TRINITY_DN1066_c0_g1_i7.p1 TRINITY_DN1066_c0_g1~~TRINITY_DN1066_c0_g1_i7.p1  ORF type:complete len:217 (-),score=32.12 TRINITY_DN1066_c0_g1_i7:584-1162(-)